MCKMHNESIKYELEQLDKILFLKWFDEEICTKVYNICHILKVYKFI